MKVPWMPAGSHTDNRYSWPERMLSYPETYRTGFMWFTLQPFHETMTIIDTERGRSAARFTLEDSRGVLYPMFMSDMLTLIKGETLIEGRTGRLLWEPCKRGQNYGIRWREES